MIRKKIYQICWKEDIVTSNNYDKEDRPAERILKLLLLLGYLKDEFIADDQ